MKKFNLARKTLACALVVCMILSTCSMAFAAGGGGGGQVAPLVPPTETIIYVSLGDSMTNGYGLEGYNGGTGVEDYGNRSYANLFEDWLSGGGAIAVDHKQLAMSAMRAEDLHWLLELDYNDAEAIAITDAEYDGGGWEAFGEEAWNNKFSTGDYWTWNELCDDYRLAEAAYAIENHGAIGSIIVEEAAIVAEYYQSAVEDADIISIGMGNGNFGVFSFGRILDAIGFGVVDGADPGEDNEAEKDAAAMRSMVYKVENAIRECDPEMQAKILELRDVLVAKIAPLRETFGASFSDTQWNALLNTVVYTGLSYVLNYAGSIEAILQLNPDAEIILVALMNTFAEPGAEVDYTNISTIGDVMGAIFEPLNMFIAGLPTFMQGINNGVYKDATFYYAEAPEVECLVNVYGDVLAGTVMPGSIIPDRFVTSIVGTPGAPGMVWGLLAPMIGGIVPGASLEFVTRSQIDAYAAMSDVDKATFAAGNLNTAISCALYLAFEDAIVEAADATVDLASVMNLGELSGDVFSGVMADFSANIEANGAAYLDSVVEFVAMQVADAINTEIGSNVIETQTQTVVEMMAERLTVEAFVASLIPTMVPGVEDLYAIHGNLEGVLECDGTMTPYCSTNCLGVQTAFNTYVADLEGAVATGNETVATIAGDLCMLLALPETLSAALANDPSINGLLGLFGRCIIGNGLGAHPSIAGHEALFNSVKKSYEEGYTAKDETINNITEIIKEYYDEAYEYAYAHADEKGYVDVAANAIDQAIKTIKELDISGLEMTDDFRAKLEAELAAVVSTLEEIKAVLEEDKASDVDGLVESVSALWDDLNAHLTNASAILAQAEFDIKTLVVPVVDAYVSALVLDLKDIATEEIAKAGHKHYEADDESYYVAIGGDTVVGTGIGRQDKGYYDLIGENYAIDKNTVAMARLLPADLSALISGNKSEIEKADLITFQMDASSIIYATLLGTPEWDNYLDAETRALIDEILKQTEDILTTNRTDYVNAKIEEIIPKIKAAVIAKLPEGVPFVEEIFDAVVEFTVPYLQDAVAKAEEKREEIASKLEAIDPMVWDYAEKLAYAVVSYIIDTKATIEEIQAINPDATLVVAGMYNAFDGFEVVVDGDIVDVGEIFDLVVDAGNVYFTALSVENDGFAFVDISDTEINGFTSAIDVTNMEIPDLAGIVLRAGESMHANAVGHKYIKDQIVKALTCDYSAYEQFDETYHYIVCSICGAEGEKEAHSGNPCAKCGYTKPATPPPGPSGPSGLGGGGGVASFLIKFETNGGSKVESVRVKKNELLAEPAAPTKDGFTFAGWYTDKALTAKYDFSTPVTKSFTLYANWAKADILAKFTDIDVNAWYYEYVKQIVELGYMNGISETEFAPNATLTRGMFVTILHRIEGTPAVEAGVDFADVAADQYYANAVKWANANGIVKGITETEFAPNADVTREQMAAMLARYADYKEIEVAVEGDVTYTDSEQISEYAKDAVKVANKLGILIGNEDGSFAPKRNATRAEAAALFVRLLGTLEK